MTEKLVSRFWIDIAEAYSKVALNPERVFSIYSSAEDLTAEISFRKDGGTVVVNVYPGEPVDRDGAFDDA